MLEILQNFEQTAGQLAPIVLIGAGLAAVLSGLFVWLGGLSLGKILAGIAGAIAGGVCGFFLFGGNIQLAGLPTIAAAAVAIILGKVLVAGSAFWRFASALFCAASGTILIFAGMILLLLYKGAAPVSCISRKPSFYAAVFIAMTAFGTIEQLLLCQLAKKRLITKKEAGKSKEESDETPSGWRTT